MNFKDLFSVQAKDYALYRPTYPRALFDYLTTLSLQKKLVWDVGTGNGQAAVELARDFRQVFATDPSEKQLSEAKVLPNITYKIERAEETQLSDGSVDLITVAQAFHWFQHEKFARTCTRVAAPGAHLAVWCYAKTIVTGELEVAVEKLYTGLLDNFWEKERRLVETGYGTIQMPFEEIKTPVFVLEADWSLDELLGYFKTWSALNTYLKTEDPLPVQKCFEEIGRAWGPVERRKVVWPLHLRVWKIKD